MRAVARVPTLPNHRRIWRTLSQDGVQDNVSVSVFRWSMLVEPAPPAAGWLEEETFVA